MRFELLSSPRLTAALGLALAVAASGGCRATRSGLAQVPGMGWIGPRDNNISLETWEGDSIPTPSQQATPQLASDGDSSPRSSDRSVASSGSDTRSYDTRSYGSDSRGSDTRSYGGDGLASDRDFGADVAESSSSGSRDYPDTGYPDPLESNRFAGSGRPDRGFYGDPTGDEGGPIDATSRAVAEAIEQGVADAEERYDDLADSAEGDLADQYLPPPHSQASDARDAVADRYSQAATTARDYASDVADDARDYADDRFDDARDYASGAADDARDFAADEFDRGRDYASDLRQPVDDYSADARDGARDQTDRWRDSAEDLADSARETYDSATDAVRDRASQLRDTAAQTTERVQERAQQIGDRARDLWNGPGADDDVASSDRTSQWGETVESARQRARDYWSTDAADAGQRSSSQDFSGAESGRPWRPGSTTDLRVAPDQGRSRTAVRPAGYSDAIAPRLSPTYR